jgi:parallel beta helix pectate lyase-like protein
VPLTIAFRGKLRAGLTALMFLLLALPLSALTPGEVAAAGTYYVSTAGSDAAGTGSLAQPWRTIQKAADSVGPGSTVLIQPGTYTGAVEIAIVGTSASPVIFRGNGAGVVIEASSVVRDAVLITESSYVTLENIRIQNAPRAGLRVSASNHVTIRHNVFANNQRWGLFTDFSDDLLIEGNESFGATIEHGIYHSNSGDRPVIRGNVIHDNYANGLHMNGDLSMGGDGTITSPIVEGNYIFNNGLGGGSGINMDGVERAMIRNNVIVDAHASGISMYQIDGGICSRNNTVYHNTIVVAADGRWAINIPNSGCTGNQLIANILYSNHSYRGAINIVDGARSGFASNYNVLEGVFSTDGGDSILTITQWKALGYDANSRVSTPSALFVNPTSDFHLKPGSPAINVGTTLSSVKTDFDGRARPQGASSDAGAFEAASPADCRLSPTSGPVYTRVTVTCTGFQSGELATVRWDGALVASFTAGSTGAGKVTFSAPRSVTGRHLVKAVGDKGTSVPSRGFVIAPSLSLSPTGGVIGQKITATMRGFGAGEVVTLRFRTAPGSSRTVARNIVASSTGTASASFLVPSGSVGKYSIEAVGSLGGFASAPFTRIFGTAEIPTATPTATATPSPTATSTPAPPEPTVTDIPPSIATPVDELPEPGGTPIG